MSQHAVPIFEVAFKNGMWWSIPADTSQRLYEHYKNAYTSQRLSQTQDIVYTWDWGNSRYGSWAPEGNVTSTSRYVIDFFTWEQRNLDSDRRRPVRLKWVPADNAFQDEASGTEWELIDGSDMATD